MGKTTERPAVDMQAVRSGDAAALVTAVAACAARWFSMADSHIAFPLRPTHVAQQAGTAKAGLLAAAMDLRELLIQSPEGREALSQLGFNSGAEGAQGPVLIDGRRGRGATPSVPLPPKDC